LKRDVFTKEGFDEWAEENVVLLELDFPRNKKIPREIKVQNSNLHRSFKVRGYPTVWVFDLGKDDSGEYQITPLGKTGYTKTLDKFTSDVERMLEKRTEGTK
jgi:protein disulfide-isomerase